MVEEMSCTFHVKENIERAIVASLWLNYATMISGLFKFSFFFSSGLCLATLPHLDCAELWNNLSRPSKATDEESNNHDSSTKRSKGSRVMIREILDVTNAGVISGY